MSKKNGFHREPIFQMPIASPAELAAKAAKNPTGPAHMFGRIHYDGMTDHEFTLCHQLAQRGALVGKLFGVAIDPMMAAQDIASIHCNHQRLKLLEWMQADQADFMHDFALIGRFIDRRNGHLIDAPHELKFADGPKL